MIEEPLVVWGFGLRVPGFPERRFGGQSIAYLFAKLGDAIPDDHRGDDPEQERGDEQVLLAPEQDEERSDDELCPPRRDEVPADVNLPNLRISSVTEPLMPGPHGPHGRVTPLPEQILEPGVDSIASGNPGEDEKRDADEKQVEHQTQNEDWKSEQRNRGHKVPQELNKYSRNLRKSQSTCSMMSNKKLAPSNA